MSDILSLFKMRATLAFIASLAVATRPIEVKYSLVARFGSPPTPDQSVRLPTC